MSITMFANTAMSLVPNTPGYMGIMSTGLPLTANATNLAATGLTHVRTNLTTEDSYRLDPSDPVVPRDTLVPVIISLAVLVGGVAAAIGAVLRSRHRRAIIAETSVKRTETSENPI